VEEEVRSGGGTGCGQGGRSRRVNEKNENNDSTLNGRKTTSGSPPEGTRSYDGLATSNRVGPRVHAHTTVRSTSTEPSHVRRSEHPP